MVLLGGSENKMGVSNLQAPSLSPDQLADQKPDQFQDQLPDQSRTILKQKHKQKQKRRRGENAQNSLAFYDQNFSPLKPAASDVIVSWCEKSGDDIVLEAMQAAVMNGGRTLKYIEKILNEWSRAGLDSLEQVRQFQNQKGSKQERKRSVPFWKKVQTENKSILDKLKKEMLA